MRPLAVALGSMDDGGPVAVLTGYRRKRRALRRPRARRGLGAARPMDDYTAAMIAEGVEEADQETQIAAWQHLVDTGLAWRLQGWFGRTASALIEDGVIQPASSGGSKPGGSKPGGGGQQRLQGLGMNVWVPRYSSSGGGRRMSNQGVIDAFLRNFNGRSAHLRVEGSTLYSYSEPIARWDGGKIVVDCAGSSVTTSTHRGKLIRTAEKVGQTIVCENVPKGYRGPKYGLPPKPPREPKPPKRGSQVPIE